MVNYFQIIFILCLISSVARFVLDSYLPSLPAISNAFGISDTRTQLTLTLYLIGFSISQLIYGPLSDHYGRRIIILFGLSIFVFGNLICAIASSPTVLLVARLIAGAGAGVCGVLNRAIASDCFKGADFSKAWSYTTTSLVVTLCVAPVVGGYIQELMGWRGNFIIATAYVTIALAIIVKFLPETNESKISKKIGEASLCTNKIIKNYYTIIINPSFISGAICYTLAFSGLIAYFQVSPLLFINHLGLSPSQYGWCSLIIALTYLAGGLIVNRFAKSLGTHYLLMSGTLLLIVGGILMMITNALHYRHIAAILLPSAIYVVGARIVIPNAIANSMQKVRHLNGSSSALLGSLQMLGASCISYWIAKFDYKTSFPLAVFLTTLGCVTLVSYLLFRASHDQVFE